MKEPVLEVRGTSWVGWLVATGPLGCLQIFDDHIELTSNCVKKENILSITSAWFFRFMLMPCAIVFTYQDPSDLKIRKMAFQTDCRNKILSTLQDLGYPVHATIHPPEPMKSFRLWRG